MDAPDSDRPTLEKGGVTAGQLILLLGGAQVLIIYVLLAVESRWSVLANRAATSWGGRIVLASIGWLVIWLVITVVMITILSIAERRAKRSSGSGAS